MLKASKPVGSKDRWSSMIRFATTRKFDRLFPRAMVPSRAGNGRVAKRLVLGLGREAEPPRILIHPEALPSIMERIEADLLIPGRGEPIRNGCVVLDGSTIAFAGPIEGAPTAPAGPAPHRVPVPS